MRISTAQIYRQGVEAFSQQQIKLSKLQQQISTGVKIIKPSDNPAVASRILELQQSISMNQQYQTNIVLADSRLSLEESALSSIENTIFRLKELAIQANNAALDPSSLSAIAVEIKVRQAELLSLANSRDGHGDYLFAGYQNTVQPFTTNHSGAINHVDYHGDAGQRAVQISRSRQVVVDDSGHELFMRLSSATALNESSAATNGGNAVMAPAQVFDASAYIPGSYEIRFGSANTYDVYDVSTGLKLVADADYGDGREIQFQGIRSAITGHPAAGDVFTIKSGLNKSIFESVALVSETLQTSSASQKEANIAEFLTDLDSFQTRILNVRTALGGRLNALDSQREINESTIVATQTMLTKIRDTDMAAAISQLSFEQTTLDAAQSVFSRITRSSLFDFLR